MAMAMAMVKKEIIFKAWILAENKAIQVTTHVFEVRLFQYYFILTTVRARLF
jgi:hypothetical protein